MLDVKGDKPGVFGENTMKAVNDYKKKHGLGNTGVWKGVVGDQTWNSIKGEPYHRKVNHDDSVYIDSTGKKIYSNTKSGVRIEKQVIIKSDQPGIIDDFKRIPTTIMPPVVKTRLVNF